MKNRNKLIDKYVKAAKGTAFLCFSAVMGGVVFPLVTFGAIQIAESNISGAEFFAVISAIVVLGGLGMGLFSCFFHALRLFREMIHRQEAMYSVVFSDTNHRALSLSVTLSDEWLIYEGNGAYYFEHIKSASYTCRTIQIRNSYPDRVLFPYKNIEVFDIALTTADGEVCEIHELEEEGLEELRSWLNDKCGLKI